MGHPQLQLIPALLPTQGPQRGLLLWPGTLTGDQPFTPASQWPCPGPYFSTSLMPSTNFHVPSMAVMSEYHKMDPNKYPNIFGCHIIYRTNIQIYLDAHELTKRISENIWIPKNWTNKYPNIFEGSWNDNINIRINLGRGKPTNRYTKSRPYKTRPGDLVMPDPFGWPFSQNLDNFRPYKNQVIKTILLNLW